MSIAHGQIVEAPVLTTIEHRPWWRSRLVLSTGLVGSPADEYVANFVRDVPRSHVLTLRWIMRPTNGADADGPRVPVTTTVRDAVPRLADSDRPILATEGDRVVGVVDREAVLRAIAGEGEGI